jgi:predicted dehydrogenase
VGRAGGEGRVSTGGMAETEVVRVGVVGVGYLGRFHAEKYARMGGVRLAAVADKEIERAYRVAEKTGASAFRDAEDLYPLVDAVSVAVPTTAHYEVARGFLDRGIDVLVEKPLAATLREARDLVRRARTKGCILQVGHLERFNPVWKALRGILVRPRFIEAHRLGPFQDRGTDVDVILDLMIHDIDVVLKYVPARLKAVESVGVPVLSANVDIANARLRFEDGSVANLTASRVSAKRSRKIRFFQKDLYVSVDYDSRQIQVYQRTFNEQGVPEIVGSQHVAPAGDALEEELKAFIESVRSRTKPEVDGEAGERALEVATKILQRVRSA